MIIAIVTSLDENNLLATPSGEIDVAGLVGRKARYLDKNGKIWPATVTGSDEQCVVIKFDNFPTGLGQGQIIEIMEESDDSRGFGN